MQSQFRLPTLFYVTAAVAVFFAVVHVMTSAEDKNSALTLVVIAAVWFGLLLHSIRHDRRNADAERLRRASEERSRTTRNS